MKKYALVNGNNVLNIVVADSQPNNVDLGFFVEYTDINPAVVGAKYDAENNKFIAPQPYASWVLDENSNWKAPVEKPEGFYRWDESQANWVEMVN